MRFSFGECIPAKRDVTFRRVPADVDADDAAGAVDDCEVDNLVGVRWVAVCEEAAVDGENEVD
jgi:hypothetical protein